VKDAAEAEVARSVFAPDLRNIAAARRFVRSVLTDLDASPHTVELAMLLASELFTNAVVHAGTRVELTIESAEAYRVAVSDHDAAAPEMGSLQPDGTSGRGLALVEEFSSDWGWHPVGEQGKTVWFELE
jgi:anti-sigma regulatory factor (Ser/Thr protein kinase)